MKHLLVILFFLNSSSILASTHFDKVVIIIENTNYSKAIALVSGSLFNVVNDKNIDIDGRASLTH